MIFKLFVCGIVVFVLTSCNHRSFNVESKYCSQEEYVFEFLEISLKDSSFFRYVAMEGVGGEIVETGKIRFTSPSMLELVMPTHILEEDTLVNGGNKTKFTVYDNRIYQELDTLIPFAFELKVGKEVYREDSCGSIYMELPERIKEVRINDRIVIKDSSFAGKWYKVFELPAPHFGKDWYVLRVKKDHLKTKAGSRYYPCTLDSVVEESVKEWKSALRL